MESRNSRGTRTHKQPSMVPLLGGDWIPSSKYKKYMFICSSLIYICSGLAEI